MLWVILLTFATKLSSLFLERLLECVLAQLDLQPTVRVRAEPPARVIVTRLCVGTWNRKSTTLFGCGCRWGDKREKQRLFSPRGRTTFQRGFLKFCSPTRVSTERPLFWPTERLWWRIFAHYDKILILSKLVGIEYGFAKKNYLCPHTCRFCCCCSCSCCGRLWAGRCGCRVSIRRRRWWRVICLVATWQVYSFPPWSTHV